MTIDEIRKEVINNLKFERVFPKPKGGQSCGMPMPDIKCYCEELDFEIRTSHFRSIVKGRDYLKNVMELIINDLIK